MAKFLLLNRVTLSNGVEIKAAKELDDLVDDIPNIVASGGITLALPNPVVEARAAQIREQQGRGRREAELDLLTAAFAEFANGASMSLAIKDEGVFVPGSPFGITNFTGAGVTVTNEGGGQAKIDIPGTPGGTVPATRMIIAGSGLTGGGDLSADRTLSADFAVANPTTIQPDATGSPGVGTTVARNDHRHAIAADPPINVGTANAEGASTSFARADHVHNLPFGPVQTALGAATSAISVNSQEVTNGTTPTAASSLATKGYVDTVAQGLDLKGSVIVISDSPIALVGLFVVDAHLLVAGERILVAGQGGDPTIPDTDNGIYVAAVGAWARSTDLATGANAAGAFSFVEMGTTHADTGWVCVNDNGSAIVGTDLLQFTQFTGGIQLATIAPVDVTKAAAVVGVSTRAAREDHKHDITTAVPLTVSSVNLEGTATSLARSDHVHSHGALAGGATHAVVTVLTNGFMISTDKSKLDGISAGAAALTAVAPTTIQPDDVPAVGVGTAAAREDHVHGIVAAAPVNVTKAANAEGVATSFARSDHKHDATTAAAGTIAVGDAAAEGAATSLSRSDHTHALPAPAAPADVTKAAASAGAATTVARSDHKHDVSTAAPGTVTFGAASEGTATSLARSDHNHALTAPGAPADVTKAAASAGASANVARQDHKHDVSTAAPGATGVATASAEGTATSLARSDHAHQSNTAPANVTKAAAAIGTSGEPARADHKHDITTATAVAVGSANAEGTSTSLSRADHVHLGDPSQLMWGNDSLTATTTTRYLTPGYGESTARTAPVQIRASRAGTLANMRVRQNTGAGNGNAIVYTVRINSVASTLTLSMASTANDGSDLTHTVAVAAGDLIDIEVTKAAAVGTTPSDNVATMEFRT